MASVIKHSDSHWEVHLASKTKSDTRVDIHMSSEAAEKILNRAKADFSGHDHENVADALLMLVSRYKAGS